MGGRKKLDNPHLKFPVSNQKTHPAFPIF